jgi:outer membrane protein assembly factor BamA
VRSHRRRGRSHLALAFAMLLALCIQGGAYARQSPGPVIAEVLQQPGSAAGASLAEIRVHGNYGTPDGEVVALSGLTVGQPIDASSIQAAKSRLEKSGRFLAVDVLERYRSLDMTVVAVVIVVQEYPVPDAAPSLLRPVRRTFRSAMFLPILSYADGYGLTYGGRISFVDGVGRGARLSVPLTWGGSKRAALEYQRDGEMGPIDLLVVSASIERHRNPFYSENDDRRSLSVGASRRLAGKLRLGLHAGMSHVGFGPFDDRAIAWGADAEFDTRQDPVFPRNAVLLSTAWEHLGFAHATSVNRFGVDARGYIGAVGQSVVSVRAIFERADGPLPPWEKYLLGGAGTLRGYRAGSFAGDALAAGSVELRVPLSSPLSFGRAGVAVFADVGTAYDHGGALGRSRFERGVGAGLFFAASVFHLNADLAHGPAGVRLHVMSGFEF